MSVLGCSNAQAYSNAVCRKDRKEVTKLRTFEGEPCFGLQIATNNIAEGVYAAQLAADAGASFLDLNCGCPIYGEPPSILLCRRKSPGDLLRNALQQCSAGPAWSPCAAAEITRRGCGAVLLRKPRKLATLVSGIVQGSPIPVTVKIRIGAAN
jgi:tRNA-dihydrouridine synthase 3